MSRHVEQSSGVSQADSASPAGRAGQPGFPGLEEAVYQHLFSDPFISYVWPDAARINPALRSRIIAHSQLHSGDKHANVGGWRSTNGHLEFLGELRQPLIERMLALVNEATRRVAADRGVPPIRAQWSYAAWANISLRDDFQTAHTHAGATWSGVYYVDAGEEAEGKGGGRLQFLDPAPGRATFLPFAVRHAPEVRPVAGLMVLFPSYVPHLVHPHESERARISIAFNFRNEPFP